MCTVSFIPVRDNWFITSNRDEKNTRKKAIAPSVYSHNGFKFIYPKDAQAGGTWIAIKENGDVAVLLNGAFICHASEPPYRKSRGQLFIEVFSSKYPARYFSKTDLFGIEPFTLVLFENKSLYEFRWDGSEKYCKQLSNSRPHIWSSATLYDGLVMKKREQWLANFLNRTHRPTQKDILAFHREAGDGDSHNDLVIDRDGIYSTVSITGVLLNKDRAVMTHVDLHHNRITEMKFGIIDTFNFV